MTNGMGIWCEPGGARQLFLPFVGDILKPLCPRTSECSSLRADFGTVFILIYFGWGKLQSTRGQLWLSSCHFSESRATQKPTVPTKSAPVQVDKFLNI